MKKLIIIALLLAVSVAAQQNMSGNITGSITQTVNGGFTLYDWQNCIEQDRLVLFGPTGVGVIGDNDCFRNDFFEVNGIISGCDGTFCNLVTTLDTELTALTPHTTKETDLVAELLTELSDSTDCLVGVYNGSMFGGTPGSIVVGSKTYFNTVKPCFVRTISALGVLEQIYIDEPNASFIVQKLQAVEQDYQHMLTIEDLKVPKSFNVTNSTLNGTLNGTVQAAGGGAELPQELAITSFAPAGSGVNTFDVVNNNGDSIEPFAISIAWTDTSGPGQCIQPIVPAECSIGPSPALATAPGLGASGIIFCNYIIQCGQGIEPFSFSFSSVGIGAPVDNFHIASILTPDGVNSNNFDIGTGLGVVIAVPFLDNPIVGSSAVAFWPSGSSLAGTIFVQGLGLAIETPTKIDMVSVSIGPSPEGAIVASGWTGTGPMNTPAPILTAAVGGTADVVTSYAFGLAGDGDTFNVIWPAVVPNTLANVGIVIANGKIDADYQVNAIGIDSVGAYVPAGMTGSFAFEGATESGTLALVVAVIVVIAAFLFVLRRRP